MSRRREITRGILALPVLLLYLLIVMQTDVSTTELNQEITLMQAISNGFDVFSPLRFALITVLIIAALKTPFVESKVRHFQFVGITSVFLTGCMLVGRAFIDPAWGNLLIRADMSYIQKWLFCLPGWMILCACAMHVLYYYMCNAHGRVIKNALDKGADGWFCRHSFVLPLLILLAFYIPVMIVTVPGIAMPVDTVNQIMQVYGEKAWGLALVYDDSSLTNHHPIAHTMLLHVFLELGKKVFNSAQVGLGLLMCLQAVATAAALALMIHRLYQEGMPANICLALTVFFGVHPRVQNVIMLISKDILYAAFFILFGVELMKIFRREENRYSMLLLTVASAGMMLMRNEGRYILMGTYAAMFLLSRINRRRAAIMLVMCTVLWTVWTGCVFPAFRISPGSSREMYSILFQQTGRCVAYHEDEITDEEKTAIDKVLHFERIRQNYHPNTADNTKALYREGTSSEDMFGYIRTWATMFTRFPMTYVEAFLELKNLMLYPTVSEIGMENTGVSYMGSAMDLQVITDVCKQFDIELHYPESLDGVRIKYEKIREKLFALPVLRLLTQGAPIVWMIVILVVYILCRKKRTAGILMVPLLLQMLVVFAGPLDAVQFRYLYPLLVYLPIVWHASVWTEYPEEK